MSVRSTPQYYKQNRLQQLRGFCYAAQTGSISKAAERLFLSQPSVSLQIQALEREFKTKLFERRGPPDQPHARGTNALRNGRSARRADGQPASHLRRQARHRRNRSPRHRRRRINDSLPFCRGFVKEFVSQYPGIELKLHNVTGRDGLAMIRADEVDFAVGSMIDVPDDIIYNPTFTYDPILITALDHPLGQPQTGHAEGGLAVSAHSSAAASDDLARGRPGVSAAQPDLRRPTRGRRLGGDQEIRRTGARYLGRYEHLPHRARETLAYSARKVLPKTLVRRRAAAWKVLHPPSAALHRRHERRNGEKPAQEGRPQTGRRADVIEG